MSLWAIRAAKPRVSLLPQSPSAAGLGSSPHRESRRGDHPHRARHDRPAARPAPSAHKRDRWERLFAMSGTGSTEQGSPAIFVYGTLMDEDILQLLLGRIPAMKDATVKGFRRYGLRNRAFPGTVRDASSSVTGKLLMGLNSREMYILDEYEDDDYDRVETVAVEEGTGQEHPAAIYLWVDRLKSDLEGEWDYDTFKRVNKASYVDMVSRFVAKDLPGLLERRRAGAAAGAANKN